VAGKDVTDRRVEQRVVERKEGAARQPEDRFYALAFEAPHDDVGSCQHLVTS
jgi:hypothetical protein